MSNIAKKYKKLDHIDHILLRPARHVGDTVPIEKSMLAAVDGKLVDMNVEMSPAFLKCFDEIIQNSFDHSRTPEGKHVDQFNVSCSPLTGAISVYDNGGIPVVKHPEHNVYIPELIFGELFSGSNFNDDDDDLANKAGGGQNGEGSSLVNVFSSMFKVETADGKKMCTVQWSNNMRTKDYVKVKKCSSKDKFTRITWRPDYERFGMTKIGHMDIAVLQRRTIEIAMSAHPIKVNFRGDDVTCNFTQFAKMINPDVIVDTTNERWRVGIAKSEQGFSHYTYVNGTNTHKGGTHVDHIMSTIVDEIRAHILKKTKQDIRPIDIKSHICLIADCQIDLPRYNSQTKEDLITRVSQFGSRYTPSSAFIKKILKSDVVANIIEWAMRKQQQEEDREARKIEKDNDKKSLNDIIKYEPATSKDPSEWMLLITEGDSAAKPLQSARQDHHGIYPLKGKPLNVFGETKASLLKNEEFNDLICILNLSVTNKSVDNIRYGRGVCICTDADLDGIHIRGLLFNIFGKFWPDAINKGLVHVLNTPVAIVQRKRGDDIEFFDQADLEKWIAKQKSNNFNVRYLKGLGSNNSVDFKRYLADDSYMQTVEPLDADDIEALDLVFNDDRANDRKQWLEE